uniref:Uncharacterized protein n=1 Tax=Anopheles dirus TaxID=7168 RepID=A0A182NYP8_9DIPT
MCACELRVRFRWPRHNNERQLCCVRKFPQKTTAPPFTVRACVFFGCAEPLKMSV